MTTSGRIIHNVHDRRAQWIGPWEVEEETIDVSRLTEADVGRTVIYQDHGRAEAGTLSSWNVSFGTVWAKFSTGDTAAACRPVDLRFAIRDVSDKFYHSPITAEEK